MPGNVSEIFFYRDRPRIVVNRQTYPVVWPLCRIKESLVTKKNVADDDFPFRRVQLYDLVGG